MSLFCSNPSFSLEVEASSLHFEVLDPPPVGGQYRSLLMPWWDHSQVCFSESPLGFEPQMPTVVIQSSAQTLFSYFKL